MGVLRRLHTFIRAFFVKHYRTQEIVRVFQTAHAQELKDTPIQSWPLIKARQEQELSLVRAGKLDIVDRKSWAWPYLPASINRLSVPIMKASPYNLRRIGRTPVPRRAMNLIKGAVISQQWDVRPLADVPAENEDEQKQRIKIAKKIFRHPNNTDSFQQFIEQGLEDMLILGAFPAEMRVTMNPLRPLKIWPVNIESIRIFAAWSESTPDMPHYAQMTGLKGERGAILFYDDELMYVRDNPASDNPFGTGKLEVAWQSVVDFLGVQAMSGRSGSDQVHKMWLWWEQPQSDAAYQIVRRHIQNELEGQAKVSIIGGMKKPEVVEIKPTTEDDLLLNWQELLIRMIANAFDMSAMALGVEHDVNRAVGEVLDDKDFRSAVVPIAKRLQEAFTRKVLHEKLGWYDLEFAFLNLDDPDKQTMMEMLARMYSTNAVTPNEIRIKMSMEKMSNPLYDLSQHEAMLMNIEAQARVQEGTQTRMMDKQSQMQEDSRDKEMQRQQDMIDKNGFPEPGQPGQMGPGQQQPGQGGPSSSIKMTPGNVARGGQPPSPKPLSLPKFPISGSRYTAKQVAQMPVNHLQELISQGQLPKPSNLLKDMHQQEPGILEQMTEEVREFFEQEIGREEAEKKQKKPTGKMLKDWQEKQSKRFKDQGKRIPDLATWLYQRGTQQGRPGGGSKRGGIVDLGKMPTGQVMRKPGGKPGNLNPTQMG